MALTYTFSIVFPRTRSLDAEGRARIAAVKRSTAIKMRELMNQYRREIRSDNIRATGKMDRSVRVRRIRASQPGAITFQLSVNTFYAHCTNAVPPHRGWWERRLAQREAQGRAILRRAQDEIGAALLAQLRLDAIKAITASAKRAGFRPSTGLGITLGGGRNLGVITVRL